MHGDEPSSGSPRTNGGKGDSIPRPAGRSGGVLDAWPALFAALAFGVSTPAAKAWLAGVPPLLASGWLYLSSGIGLSLWLGVRRRREAPLSRADLPWLAGAIAAGGIVAPYAYLRGLETTPAYAVSLLLNLEVVFTTVLAIAFFREAVDGRRRLGIAMIVLGSAWCAWLSAESAGGAGRLEGGLFVALACLCWAADNNLTRRIAAKDAADVARWKGLVGGAASIAIGVAAAGGKVAPPAAIAWIGGAAIGVVGYGFSLALFIGSLRRLGVARTSALFGTAPFLGVVASAIVLGERLSPWTAAAGGVIALGAVLLVLERHSHVHVHGAMEHEHLHVHDEHHRHAHAGGEGPEPHSHPHEHDPLTHEHPHRPDLHHTHGHDVG